jgi:hypothetical protein
MKTERTCEGWNFRWIVQWRHFMNKWWMKMAAFWVVAPCNLVEVYRCFRGACWHYHKGDRSDDGGSEHPWNISKLLPVCTAQQPRRQPSSYLSPWEPQNSRWWTFVYMKYKQYLVERSEFQMLREDRSMDLYMLRTHIEFPNYRFTFTKVTTATNI